MRKTLDNHARLEVLFGTMGPSRILMAAQPTVGHTNALRAIGVRLREQGHAVAMAMTVVRPPFIDWWPEPLRAAARIPEALARDGIELLPLPPVLSSLWHAVRLPTATGYEELGLALEFFTAGLAGQAKRIAEHARRWKADAVLGDYLMPAGLLGAELAALPFAALYHSALPFPAEGVPPFGSGLPLGAPRDAAWTRAEAHLQRLMERFDARFSRAARELGLPSRRPGLLMRPLSGQLNLLATHPELEPGLLPLEGPVLMTGPCLPRVVEAELDDPALRVLRETARRVYVSLGTVFNGQPRVYETILDGVVSDDTQVIVSAGSSLERLSHRAGPGTHLFRRVPQVALLSRVDVVITHGGNNTVQETLAAGRPLVVVPFGGDQLANARRVERLGVGSAILPADLTAGSVRRAVEAALVPAVVQRARALGQSLAGIDGTARAAEAVLELVSA